MSTPTPVPTKLVINPPNQRISFKLPITYTDNVTALPPISFIKIEVRAASGGPAVKTIQDTDFTVDTDGFCNYKLSNLGVDLTKPTYAVLYTDIPGAESDPTPEIGFQNLAPNPPQAASAN